MNKTLNHKPKLKPDRGVMDNPIDLKGFIQIASTSTKEAAGPSSTAKTRSA